MAGCNCYKQRLLTRRLGGTAACLTLSDQPPKNSLFDELPPFRADLQPAVPGVPIIDLLHLVHGVEEAHHVGGAERVARTHAPTADLLDQADVAALVAPRFV